MDEMIKFIEDTTKAGDAAREILGRIRIGAAYLAELRGTYDETLPAYADLVGPESRAFLAGMALAWASVKMFDTCDYMEGASTGSGALDRIVMELQENMRKFCLNEIRLSMDDALENLLAKEGRLE